MMVRERHRISMVPDLDTVFVFFVKAAQVDVLSNCRKVA